MSGGGVVEGSTRQHTHIHNGGGERIGIFTVWCGGVDGVESTRTSLKSPKDWGQGPFTEARASLFESIYSTPAPSPARSGPKQFRVFVNGSVVAAVRVWPISISMHFKDIQKCFTFNSAQLQAWTVMRSSPPVAASSPIYSQHTGDELNRQVQCCSEWQFAFWKSGSAFFVLPEIELAHQLTLNNSLLCPPPTFLTLCSLSLCAPLMLKLTFESASISTRLQKKTFLNWNDILYHTNVNKGFNAKDKTGIQAHEQFWNVWWRLKWMTIIPGKNNYSNDKYSNDSVAENLPGPSCLLRGGPHDVWRPHFIPKSSFNGHSWITTVGINTSGQIAWLRREERKEVIRHTAHDSSKWM